MVLGTMANMQNVNSGLLDCKQHTMRLVEMLSDGTPKYF